MQAWESFLKSQEIHLGKPSVDKWLRTLEVVSFDACNLYLRANDAFHLNWFNEHMRGSVESALFNNNGRRIKVHIGLGAIQELPVSPLHDNEDKKTESFAPDVLEPHCTFSQFVAGQKSLIAYQILSELVGYQAESGRFAKPKLKLGELNPIYLFGPSGVGKTHLLMALSSSMNNRGLKTRYVKTETFVAHVVKAFRSSLVDEFRKTYRKLDALIIDDVHILGRKNASQEEFFHTFNALHTAGIQIILSANAPPRELSDIEERLISRFEWGITLNLGQLTEEELTVVARRRSSMLQFPLSDPIIHTLVKTFKNHKSLTRAIEALVLRTHIDRRKEALDVDAVKHYLEDLVAKEEERGLTPGKILQHVARQFGIKIDDLLGKSRKKDFALPRQIAMYLCRNELKMPFIKIGDLFSRDHSTVMASVRLVHEGIEKRDAQITAPLTEIARSS